MSACGCTDPECRLTGCKSGKAMENPQQLVGAPIVESLAGGGKGPYAGKTVWITYGNPPPDPRDEEIARLREALRHISLCSQNSMSSKEECGRIARAALNGEKELS